jgi:hypothetical protein
MKRMGWLVGLALLLLMATGCQTAPLCGTKWQVVEVLGPDPEDRERIEENIEAMTVEFTPDGKIITETTRPDGSIERKDDSRFKIDGEVIILSTPEYDMHVMYRFEGEQLRVHSEQFVMLMDPIKEQ